MAKGWVRDSARHALARKRIRTGRKKSPYKEFVRLGYGTERGGRASLNFRTEGVNPSEAKKLVNVIGNYNAFNPKLVNEAIDKISPIISSIEVGREGSPVLYISTPVWTTQHWDSPHGMEGRIYSSEEILAIKQKVMDAFKVAKADEIDNVYGSVIRVWWD